MTTSSPAGAADLFDHALDLVVGSSCLGCRRRGRLLCGPCRATLLLAPVPGWPTPTPAGLAAPWAAGAYDGLLRRLVIDHKEESRFGLGRPLGELLGRVVAAAVPPSASGVVLVPVPSRPGVARRRGDDPTGRLVRHAARHLARVGIQARVAGLLRSHRGVLDQSGLDASARARNLRGSMWVPSAPLARLARRGGGAPVVVCDDVLTTGSTVREAQRALAAVGVEVSAIAVVAAVPRRGRGV